MILQRDNADFVHVAFTKQAVDVQLPESLYPTITVTARCVVRKF